MTAKDQLAEFVRERIDQLAFVIKETEGALEKLALAKVYQESRLSELKKELAEFQALEAEQKSTETRADEVYD